MNSRWLTIKQLDKQLNDWQTVSYQYPRPKVGWVKTIRSALTMSVEQLASRLGLSRGRIAQLESAEIDDAVTLHTLKKVAEAMDCEFVYAIVPKRMTTIESIIHKQAELVANHRVDRTAHTMSLESQSVASDYLKKQKEELTKKLIDHLDKKLWKK